MYIYIDATAGDKCFRVVHVTVEESNDLSWNDALNVCRGGPGLAPDLASIQSLHETGQSIFCLLVQNLISVAYRLF